ncbi:MAG: hypothetical protein OCD01_19105 [Fibrobacterales bacterium]
MLREEIIDEDVLDLENVIMSHYRLSEIRRQDLKLKVNSGAELDPPGTGGAKSTKSTKDKKEEFLSQIITRLSVIFITDELTDKDMVSYAYTIRDTMTDNARVMNQIQNNSPEQAMLGDYPKALEEAIMDSGEAHSNQMMQLLGDPQKSKDFAQVVFDMLTVIGGLPGQGVGSYVGR